MNSQAAEVDTLTHPVPGKSGSFLTEAGYASASSNSPNSAEKAGLDCKVTNTVRGAPVESGRATPILFKLAAGRGLQSFEKAVDEKTINRFKDVLERLELPLLKHMAKSSRTLKHSSPKFKPMAIRLMVIGRTEADAKPSIVVFCSADQVNRARRFFHKAFAKDLYCPTDPVLPSFDVHLFGQSPRMTSLKAYKGRKSTNTYGPGTTLCGAPLKLVKEEQSRIVTLGGLIKVQMSHDRGEYRIYGMTAGHVIEELSSSSQDHEVCSVPFDEDIDDGESDASHTEDESELDFFKMTLAKNSAPIVQRTGHNATPMLDAPAEVEPNLGEPDEWDQLGKVLASGNDQASPFFYDWALIEIEEVNGYGPNRLYDPSGSQRCRKEDLQLPSRDTMDAVTSKSVVMMSGSQGFKQGKLSALPSKVRLYPGTRLIDMYTLTLNDRAEIQDGDSGSWIVSKTTLEVFEHVVASDAFGDGYVIPIHSIFTDIKNKLSVEQVELPASLEIAFERFAQEVCLGPVPTNGPRTPTSSDMQQNPSPTGDLPRPESVALENFQDSAYSSLGGSPLKHYQPPSSDEGNPPKKKLRFEELVPQ